jgi:glyoxylase-like metal-dependent hydrolase (beta-lactamase superfamily II)
MHQFIVAALLAAAAPALAQPPAGATPAGPARSIVPVRGDLYKVQSGPGVQPVTVFLVTGDGIVLADPLNPETATWLKGELAQRFPGKAVKYVLETHYHWDHARGGKVFADTAQFVAQEEMPKNLARTIREAPPPGDTADVDGDNRLSRAEAKTGTLAQFDRLDADHDGFLTQADMAADIAAPTITFRDRYTVSLGGERVELIHAGNRHSSDLYDVYFPKERVLFAGDYVWINRMCCGFAFDRRPMSAWINSLKRLEALDFDLLVNSHWASGTKADLTTFRQYLEDLQAAVSEGVRQGKSLEELQRTVTLDKYKAFTGYDMQRPQMIASAYESVTRYGP